MPDITDDEPELAYLQEQTKNRGQEATSVPMSMASLDSVPLDERSEPLQIAHMAFLTLFPTGMVSMISLREKTVVMADYQFDLIRHRDDRFARHTQFRFWALTAQMRHQTFARSK